MTCNQCTHNCDACQIVPFLKKAVETSQKTIIRIIQNQEPFTPTKEEFNKNFNPN